MCLKPLVRAERRELPPTLSKLTLSAMRLRSSSFRLATYCAEPVSAHSSTLKNASLSPRRQLRTCGETVRHYPLPRTKPGSLARLYRVAQECSYESPSAQLKRQ